MKNTLPIVPLMLVCMMLSACGSAPLVIMGRVTNESGIAVKGASVRTEPYTDSVSTNHEGYFFINRHLIHRGQEIKQLTIVLWGKSTITCFNFIKNQ